MKYATYKWNVQITINGKSGVPEYYGYRTKREAEAIAHNWRRAGYHALVIRY